MSRWLAILVALLALGAAACGGDDSDPRDRAENSPPAEEPQPETASETSTSAATTEEEPKTLPPKSDDPQDSGNSAKVSASDFPDGTWPLTIESGELRCEDKANRRTIIFRANGRDYPVNGVAEGGRVVGIEPIWKKKQDSSAAGTRVDISPLFKRGYELCD